MKIEQTLKQSGVLSPQLIQSMEVLQMSSAELEEHLAQLALENPVMELSPPGHACDSGGGADDAAHRLRWLEDNDAQNALYHRGDAESGTDPLERAVGRSGFEPDLYSHIAAQLERSGAQSAAKRAALFLAACLDDRGWLPGGTDGLDSESGLSPGELRAGLDLLRSLDPAGVGAAGLGDCLALQLERAGEPEWMSALAREHLEELSRGRFRAAAQKLAVPESEVRRAAGIIQKLDPRPCEDFKRQDAPVFVVPDVFITEEDGELHAAPNGGSVPRLRASRFYLRMLSETDDGEVRAYLEEKFRQYHAAARAVSQRGSTLLACAGRIAERQRGFFLSGEPLVPMAHADIAADLGVHASTVSRAVRGKFLQCRRGVFPLSYFFSRAAGGLGQRSAVELLRAVIASEDRRRPLSDREIAERLSEAGFAVSRRTAAKYRSALGIPDAAARRER